MYHLPDTEFYQAEPMQQFAGGVTDAPRKLSRAARTASSIVNAGFAAIAAAARFATANANSESLFVLTN